MAEETYCICGQPYDSDQFMIQCDGCNDWFHGSCVDLDDFVAPEVDKFHCPSCEYFRGPSILKQRTNWHRHDMYELDSENKPVQSGTAVFIKELSSRHFPSADDIVLKMAGQQLTVPFLQRNGFNDPILITQKDGLGMIVPPEVFTVDDVEYYVGPDRKVDVIDVTRQEGIRMKLGDFVKYFKNPNRNRVLNLISLEFTGTPLSASVEAPFIARSLDWLNQVWPKDAPDDGSLEKPQVEKYCLLSVKDSYTDFHVDFGGTSVWYHLLWGEKIFYLIKPTPANLSLYQRWTSSATQSETFFGDQVDMCYKCVLKQGQTMLIPTGWIHAVLTPEDSLVFGGNFLHSLNIALQLQVNEIEQSMKIAKKFLYPSFQKVNWFAACSLLEQLKRENDLGCRCPPYLLQGLKALVVSLKQWSQDKDLHKHNREEIPEGIDHHKLLKDLNKEIRHAERFINSLNPPKPERESKRKKRKPANEDFVDISQSLLLSGLEGFNEKGSVKLAIKGSGKKRDQIHSAKEEPKSPIKLTLMKPPMQSCAPGAAVNYTVSPKVEKRVDSYVLSENKDALRKAWSLIGDSPLQMKIKANKVKSPKMTSNLITEKEKTVIRLKMESKTEKVNASDSIYDFHEDSDGDSLMIDENPGKIRKHYSVDGIAMHKAKQHGLILINGESEPVMEMEVAGEVDVISDAPKNGIEELLKASVLTSESVDDGSCSDDHQVEIMTNNSPNASPVISERSKRGINSPGTRDAIAGMLSFSRATVPKTSKAGWNINKSKQHTAVDDDEEGIHNVHQDEDFIYPALDASDDEEGFGKSRASSKKLDEAWSPRARVGPVTPKTNRPVREGKKRTAVEKGLEAAAAKRANLPAPKRQYLKKKVKKPVELKPALPGSETTTKPIVVKPTKKPKKGMATAKQRLGKILKIHKMLTP